MEGTSLGGFEDFSRGLIIKKRWAAHTCSLARAPARLVSVHWRAAHCCACREREEDEGIVTFRFIVSGSPLAPTATPSDHLA